MVYDRHGDNIGGGSPAGEGVPHTESVDAFCQVEPPGGGDFLGNHGG